MSIVSRIGAVVKEHPVPTALGAVGVAVVFYLITRGGSSSSDAGQIASANATATSAYYAAEGQQGAAGDQLQATAIAAQAQTAQTQITTDAATQQASIWASEGLATTQANDATAAQLAPYQVQGQLITTLGQVASLPPTSTTSTSSNSGFLGIGASSKTSTTVTPNAAALSASSELAALESQYNAMAG